MVLALVVVFLISACGGDDDSRTAVTKDSAKPGDGSTVSCVDETGDAGAMKIGESLDDAVASMIDLAAVRLNVDGDALAVEWTLTPGGAAEVERGGNQKLDIDMERADGGYPLIALGVIRSGGVAPSANLATTTQAKGVVRENDLKDVLVAVDGDAVRVDIPLVRLGALGEQDWRWSAEVTASRAGQIGQDACGSAEQGVGSRIVFFEGPQLPPSDATPKPTAARACDRIPPIEEIEAVVGVEMVGPSGRYDTECGYVGAADPTDNVLFSVFPQGEICSGRDVPGELGDIPYRLSGGVVGVVELCLPDEDLQVSASIGSIDDDDGPLALMLARAWVGVLETAG